MISLGKSICILTFTELCRIIIGSFDIILFFNAPWHCLTTIKKDNAEGTKRRVESYETIFSLMFETIIRKILESLIHLTIVGSLWENSMSKTQNVFT